MEPLIKVRSYVALMPRDCLLLLFSIQNFYFLTKATQEASNANIFSSICTVHIHRSSMEFTVDLLRIFRKFCIVYVSPFFGHSSTLVYCTYYAANS